MAALLSVVVPFYGVQDYLAECLESLRRQTLADLEVILVDDGSHDEGWRIARSYARADDRFRVVEQVNAGLGPARNTGAALASGRYLTFVDSDDLVPARAYELMVGTLERSGSDFAAGNACRFDAVDGVRPSWAHREAFAVDDIGTSISQRPDLVGDRMAWNKVYRRDFWERHGFAFPAIRYEDYPVSMAAHLAARAVDILSDPIYYWRVRESGGSITQAVHDLGNLADRVDSAVRTLDIVTGAPAEVRWGLQVLLLRVDLAAIARALVSVPPEQWPTIAALGRQLARRVEPAAAARRPLVDRLMLRALQAGDVRTTRALAALRVAGDDPAARRRRRFARQGYQILRRTWTAHCVVDPLTATVTADGVVGEWRISGRAWIGDLSMGRGSAVRAVLVGPGDLTVELPVERRQGSDELGRPDRSGFELRVPASAVATALASGGRCTVRLDVRSGGVRRSVLVPLASGPRNPAAPLSDQVSGWVGEQQGWVVAGAGDTGVLGFTAVPDPARVEAAEPTGAGLVLRGTCPDGPGLLVSSGPRPEAPVEIPAVWDGTRFAATVEAAAAFGTVADDPWTGASVRTIARRGADGELRPLVWAGGPVVTLGTRSCGAGPDGQALIRRP
ncbi:CDP-glycerol glycerophosphotransferase [Raineyella antarctica]|uniref:CDP-glycerol glycerophosphotransferase n=1 Tax=Raineyella antarctica TaxID=1577474 RepID=A0A1G6GFM1_9ACTN|nr:glycosyltransferase [Raineyella antarctica]SDB80623.1 CDP-glycerol glycerophosphotransferase [Raineyella antarctica]